jgi:hypothetical protein
MVRRGSRVRVPERACGARLQIEEFSGVVRLVSGIACEHGANKLVTSGLRVERHRRSVACLAGDVDHRSALGQKQGDERVSQVVGPTDFETSPGRGGVEHAPPPVPVVVVVPDVTAGVRKQANMFDQCESATSSDSSRTRFPDCPSWSRGNDDVATPVQAVGRRLQKERGHIRA